MAKNYYNIRESTGFKNVSLSVGTFCCHWQRETYTPHRISFAPKHQVRPGRPKNDLLFWVFVLDEVVTFIHPDDLDLYNAWDSRAFELQVANHELLGHGSGKLFQEAADGSKNFVPEKVSLAWIQCVKISGQWTLWQVINPLTGKLM